MDADQSKGQACIGAAAVDPAEECSSDERAVLDQLSEHFKQINDILALVESEHSREVELAVNCDSVGRLTSPNQSLPSPGLQSSLTSPLNAHVIDDLIRDSVHDGDSLITQDYINSQGDLNSSYGSSDDPESRTRRTLQTLAQLAELVDKNNLAVSTETNDCSPRSHCDTNSKSANNANISKHGKTSALSNFRPEKPILLVSKVRAGLELLKQRQIAKVKSAKRDKSVNLTNKNRHVESCKTSSKPDNTENSLNNSSAQPEINHQANEQILKFLQNVVFLLCDNNQLIPMVIVPQQPELNDSNTTNTANVNAQPIIFIPYETAKTTESACSTSEGATGELQPIIVIPPIVTANQTCVTNLSSGESDRPTQGLNEPTHTEEPLETSPATLTDPLNDSVNDSLDAALIAETSSDGSEVSLNIKSSKEEFECQYCTATFKRFCNFAKHLLVHNVFFSEDDVYSCEFCDRKFLQRCDLNRHLLVHNGTEPHRCEICNKAYIRKSDLVVHMRYHTKEKPFSCKICKKGFAQLGDLSRHVRRVHEKAAVISCGHCKRKYAKEATLIRHMKVAHQDVILHSIIEQQQQ